MLVRIVYVYPIIGNDHYLNLALRFIQTYHDNPAGYPHESIVVCNGGKPTDETEFLFGGLENVKLLHHDNSGQDCGAYQHAARDSADADLMVFFGASTYLKGPNWLARMVQSFVKHGNGLYGVMGNRGVPGTTIHQHIRTTGFWIAPKLFNQYPLQVTDPSHRYAFEHGENGLTMWVKSKGLTPWVVTWDGEYRWEQWDSFPNGYRRGDQSALLCGDRLTCPPMFPIP